MDLYIQKYKSFDEEDRDHEENFFIVGSPRSGTTLIESVVTANDKVFSGRIKKRKRYNRKMFYRRNKVLVT